ncbi:Transcriptional regulator, MarR family OS=Tsukamurella paurometabola (strain ATCC 8368 / DSM/ CCUG 35730 / CIP 100753 / JCM 10117 / KCTC 9821 / NBRC 16120/ NCIMB 702349 / NCTC 13040) OX=521096 GN=Tpau_3088 PE=4 SV=1 [Tsukamurella paurometabola]|uniref:Transcriptional regulator, MarR family n=1 Tax=Tsukamurella paurometabola (strain ATCC 8368 / DSM 20162 / CCUG 35730 / CIP 100753 / JCM 10117 / KCTC 9821 / NBRC 16120 / NCIMB 702349 / NCTC 13040) TaxID=521096 RepID=D5UUW2_TSUPD|nr:MarR family winged helix-turn-helix transcriptional regulator [Tsukamurella paurometabola]ADG79680.1 transcriptional regulator, MarR family [Tsukamurella paurometabola DSM 20162]SUP36732.1 transcriptional regulator SlyA [Tsukamurella paurometabola]
MAEHEETCDFGWSLGVLNKAYADEVAPILERLPRGVRGYQTLYAAATYDLPTQLALAEYLMIDKSVMPYVVDDLVAAGLVTREPSPTDRRTRRVVPTAAGLAALSDVSAAVGAAEARLLGPLSPDDAQALRRAVAIVARTSRDG